MASTSSKRAFTTSPAARSARLFSLAGAVRAAARPGAPSLADRARAVPRMISAAASGRFGGMRGRLALMALAAAYVVSPLDLVPEGLLGAFGLVDDTVVVAWLATALIGATDEFLRWESGSYANPRDRSATYPQDAPAHR